MFHHTASTITFFYLCQMKHKIVFALIALSVILSGCDNFEYHPYAAKIEGKTGVNKANIKRICTGITALPLKFAFITDTQSAYDETAKAIDIIRQRGDIDFIVHGGDQTDFGLPKEFMWCRDILEKARIPYFAVIGNHDCLGNGEDSFTYIYGRKNFSFNVAGVHFLCLNTNALEYDYSEPVPDLDFMERDANDVKALNSSTPGTITHTVVIMHSRPYDEQFNNNLAKVFLLYLLQFPGMESDAPSRQGGDFAGSRQKAFCVNGHNHHMAVNDIYDQGILFYQCANMERRSFFVFTITPEGYEMETVEF